MEAALLAAMRADSLADLQSSESTATVVSDALTETDLGGQIAETFTTPEFHKDTFTGGDGDNVANRDPDIGSRMVKVGSNVGDLLLTENNSCRLNGNATAFYYAPETPVGTDMEVSGIWRNIADVENHQIGLAWNMQPGYVRGYVMLYFGNSTYACLKHTELGNVPLASGALLLPPGTDYAWVCTTDAEGYIHVKQNGAYVFDPVLDPGIPLTGGSIGVYVSGGSVLINASNGFRLSNLKGTVRNAIETVSYPCILQEDTKPREMTDPGGKLTAFTAWICVLPWNAELSPADTLEIDGRRYSVLGFDNARTDRFNTRATLRRAD